MDGWMVACSCSNTYMCHSQKVWDHGGDTNRQASTAGKSPTAGLPSAPLCREEQEHWHRALQNDLQQVTRVHVPVPRRPDMYKHYTEQFRSATSISNGDLVSARDHSPHLSPTPSFSGTHPWPHQEHVIITLPQEEALYTIRTVCISGSRIYFGKILYYCFEEDRALLSAFLV